MPAMGLDRPSDALAVTGRVGRWHLTLMEIPSAGADRVTSVHKNSFVTLLEPRFCGAFYFPFHQFLTTTRAPCRSGDRWQPKRKARPRARKVRRLRDLKPLANSAGLTRRCGNRLAS